MVLALLLLGFVVVVVGLLCRFLFLPGRVASGVGGRGDWSRLGRGSLIERMMR